jgi:cysteine synthase
VKLNCHGATSRPNLLMGLGNTPLIRINSLSDALGVEILGKAEVCKTEIHTDVELKTLKVPQSWWKCQRSSSAETYAVPFWHLTTIQVQPFFTVIEDAEHQGLIYPYTGSRIFEGTVGSTGISIATVARAK